MTSKPIVFADFPAGQIMGELTEIPTDAQCDKWDQVFPWNTAGRDELPVGMATVLMMRAYLHVVSPRPPGNLHTRQQMRLHSRVRRGESVTTTISCGSKELRGERRMVVLNAEGRGADDRLLFDGIITLYWAA